MFFLIEETPPDVIVEKFDYITRIEDDLFDATLLMNASLATEITENFLGIPETPTEEDILDCLQEVVNMMAGNFVGAVYPEHDRLLPFPRAARFDGILPDDAHEKDLIFYRERPLAVFFKAHK
ncbi:MAG: hypothetical protein K8R90_06420 [Candidatus Cloacimonetes bacterium]|nr:hypothetical protein [Candidatus Cloacimonadota bacterium]